MASSARVQAEQHINRLRRGLAARLLGPGVLLLHIGIFLIAATALILINLYRHPSGLTVDGALRTWAAIVAFHALIVALFPVVRWSVMTSAAEGYDPLQWVRGASTRVRMPAPHVPSTGERPPLAARVRSNLTQPISLDAFQGQSVQAIWQRVTVRWQRLTNAQIMPPADGPTGGTLYQNGHHSTITAESGAYEVVTTSQTYSGSSSPASSWPQRNGTHSTNGATSQPVSWPQRPATPVSPTQSEPPAVSADPLAMNGAGAGESTDPPHRAWLETASASWLTRPDQGEPEPTSDEQNNGSAPVTPDSPIPPATE